MIADDIEITIDFNHTTPDGAYIDKKGTATNYLKNVPEEHGMVSLGAAIRTALCQQSPSSTQAIFLSNNVCV